MCYNIFRFSEKQTKGVIMDRETMNQNKTRLPDLFDEALELEDVSIPDSFPEEELIEAPETETAQPLEADPTFFDEQVINVPMIDPPDMKNISSYPDAQIYDHLVSLEDDYLQDEVIEEDIVSVIPEIEPLPQPEAAPRRMTVPKTAAQPAVSAKRPGKKPPVKRAGMPKEEPVAEPVVIEEPAEAPVRKKPRVKRAGEKAAAPAAAPAAMPKTKMIPEPEETILPDLEDDILSDLGDDILPDLEEFVDVEEEPIETAPASKEDNSPIALMNVGSPRKAPAKKPAGKAPAKRAGGARPSSAKKPASRPQRAKERAAEEAELPAAPAKKPARKKLPFSPLEKMKQKLAQKWS